MAPAVTQLETAGVPVRHVNVRQEPDLARRYGIAQTPTFVVLANGREVSRLVGMQSIENLSKALSLDPRALYSAGHSRSPSPVNAQLTSAAKSAAPTLNPNPRPAPSISPQQAIAMAQAATVRLKVHDGRGYGAGTGTIIDVQGGEALVMTCGHLFRDNKGKGRNGTIDASGQLNR